MNDSAATTEASGFELEFLGKVEKLSCKIVVKFSKILEPKIVCFLIGDRSLDLNFLELIFIDRRLKEPDQPKSLVLLHVGLDFNRLVAHGVNMKVYKIK